MVERAVARAEARRRADGAVDVVQRVGHRGLQSRPRASPAVIAAESVQPVPWVDVVSMRGRRKWIDAFGGHQDVGDLVALEVAALDERGRGAASSSAWPARSIVGHVVHGAAGEDRRLVEVGGHQRGERQQQLADDRLGFRR